MVTSRASSAAEIPTNSPAPGPRSAPGPRAPARGLSERNGPAPASEAFLPDANVLPEPSLLFVFLNLRAGSEGAEVASRARRVPGVVDVHGVIGEFDLLVEVAHPVTRDQPLPRGLVQLSGTRVALVLLAGSGMVRPPVSRASPRRARGLLDRLQRDRPTSTSTRWIPSTARVPGR